MDTKIRGCSSPIIVPLYLQALHPQIQPISDHKHSTEFTEKFLCIRAVLFKDHLYPTVCLIHSPAGGKEVDSTLSIMIVLL